MRKSTCVAICLVGAFLLALAAGPASAKIWWPEKWWPSKWGPDDEKGSFNTVTPKSVMAALQIPKEGKIYRLGIPYAMGMPLFGKRTYALHIPGLPTGGVLGDNKIVWNDEFICGELGQIGTQFDAAGHVGIMGPDGKMRWYNGRELATPENTYGFKQNGVEKLGPCVSRGVLIDMPGLLGRDMKLGEVITPAHIEECVKKAGIAPIAEANTVLFNTGWGKLYFDNPAEFNKGCPGVGIEALKYLVSKNLSMIGSDTWPTQCIPEEDPDGAFAYHNYMQTVNGLWNIENLDTRVMSQMAKDGVYDFLYIYIPVPFSGATGSPGEPIAIK
jgi:kynurenine formamidase